MSTATPPPGTGEASASASTSRGAHRTQQAAPSEPAQGPSAAATPHTTEAGADPAKGGGSRPGRHKAAARTSSPAPTAERIVKAAGQVRELVLSGDAAKLPRRPAVEPDMDAATATTRPRVATSRVLEPFTIDQGRYFYRDRIAFVDQGESITAHDTTARTARGIVELASAKGWRGVEVEGSTALQRQVFIEASARGIRVALRDYQPTPEDRQVVESRLRASPDADRSSIAARTATTSRTQGSVRPTKDPVVVDFGRAPYEFRQGADPSYYLRTRADDGRERVQWGKQLEAAIRQADAQPGDRVRVERTGSEAVQVAARRPMADGRWETVKIETMRNTFRIEITERPRETARTAPAAAVEQALRGQNVPQGTIDRTLRAFDNAERRAADKGVTIEARGYDPAAPRAAPTPTIQPGHESSHTRTR